MKLTTTQKQATDRLKAMTDQEIMRTWDALKECKLHSQFDTINNIPTDDWIELVYIEATKREIVV